MVQVAAPDREGLRRLAEVRLDRPIVLSLYLDLDPAQFAAPRARSTQVRSLTDDADRRIRETAGLSHQDRLDLARSLERAREFLQGQLDAGGAHGLALFACEPANLFETVKLPRSVESRVAIDRSPLVGPLAGLERRERWCVALVSRRDARVFRGSPAGLRERESLRDEVHGQHDQGGWSQARYQRSVEKEKDDHLLHVADVALALYKRRGFDHLLVGAPEETVHELEEKLHPYLRERIAGRVELDVENASLDEVRRCAAERIEDHARRGEREALDRLAEGVGRGERGAAGLAAVLQALNEARVEILLIADGFRSPGGRDRETGMLHPGDEGPDGRELEHCENIVELAVEKAIEQSAKVIKVLRHDDLGPLGGIGAVLRY